MKFNAALQDVCKALHFFGDRKVKMHQLSQMFYVLCPVRVQSIMISMSVCLSVHSHVSKTTRPDFTHIFCTCYMWLWIGPLMAVHYTMNFQFYG